MATSIGFDSKELDNLYADMFQFATDEFPRETKKFVNEEGNEARRILRYETRSRTKRHTGNLLKGIDKGPVYKHDDEFSQRVKNRAPHAWLVEHGHVMWIYGKPTERRVPGKHPAAYATNKMRYKYPADAEKFIDRLIDDLTK